MTDMTGPICLAETYARAFHAGDADALRDIFLPHCNLQFVDGDRLKSFEASTWIDIVAGRPSHKSQSRPFDYRLISAYMAGPNCAAVALEMAGEPGYRFSDLLHMLCIGGSWKIVAKCFSVLPVGTVSSGVNQAG
ncbi:nuclear transport factor 2 family protein [Hoeflea sp. WL0058]|uniref:Nuclear transport factor 2 family protein n=1 Tax=Flavimaribacter sediminis TaxID=2865987 RepID=A0AAE2ZLE7_9HYPH|nr:nuclear transport factor 2 family protein [Flavimaribacter sediminis]MBW8638703.1 nuclear transport factor 2 family protein [Flavimaribacter sediminis]